MLLKQFTVAHCFPFGAGPTVAANNLRSKCKEICPSAHGPKLGDHVTLLPPFRAPADEMRQFAMGINIAQAFYNVGTKKTYAQTHGLKFFRNKNSDALVVEILLPPIYRLMIEECRRQLSGFNEWVFPLLGDTYDPHLCIVEGPGLYDELSQHLHVLSRLMPTMSFPLSSFKVMEKVTEGGVSRWEEFDPKKY